MEKGPCNVNGVNGSSNLMISHLLCAERTRSYVNGARLVSTEGRWRRDQDEYILIVAMHAAAETASVGAISVPAYRGQRRHGDMRHPTSRPKSWNSIYFRGPQGRYDTAVCKGWRRPSHM